MKIAVAGGTGVAGRWTVEALRAGDQEAFVIARSAGVDLVTGEGLEAALAGVDAVIDATNVASTGRRVSSEFFEATARTLMRTAATAGVRHIVALSIVGIDRVPYGYYQGKLRPEQVLPDSAVPVSILRAAQFHEFAGQYLAKVPGPVVIVPRWRAEPVAAREVGAALAQIAVGDPVAMSELAGPREEIMADMIRQVVRARGDRRLVVSVRMPGAAGQALAAGGGLSERPGRRRTPTFTDWVTRARARGALSTPARTCWPLPSARRGRGWSGWRTRSSAATARPRTSSRTAGSG